MDIAAVRDRVLVACAHPLRTRLLIALEDGAASPSELAERLGEPLHAVGYHMRRLVELGSIELVDTRTVRGSIEHFYRRVERPWLSDEQFAQLDADERRGFMAAILADVVRDAVAALAADGFSARADVQLARAPLTLDEEAWQELAGLVQGVLVRAHELEAETLERQGESGETIAARLAFMLFEPAPAD